MPRFALVIVLVLPAAVLACGASEDPSPDLPAAAGGASNPAARLASARGATIAAGTARAAITATVALAGLPATSVTGKGVIDFGARRGASTIDLSPILPGPSSHPPTLDTIVDGGVVYVRSPLLDLLGPLETPWVRIDGADGPPAGGAGRRELAMVPGSDPLAPLTFLTAVEAASVEDLGSEEVGGVTTTHLRASVDLREAAAAAGVEAVGRSLAALGAGRLTVDAHLDHDDRLRRLVYDHPLPPGWGDGSQRIELEYFDFGGRIDVDLPSEGEVSDLSAVLGSDS